MIEIFIPVLFVCLNSTCEFMQGTTVYFSDEDCRISLEMQKRHMKQLIKKAGKGNAQILEGTCIDAEIKAVKGKIT